MNGLKALTQLEKEDHLLKRKKPDLAVNILSGPEKSST